MSMDILGAFEIVFDNIDMIATERINLGVLELSRADLVFEEDIEFTVSAALGFWKAEEGPDDAKEAGTGSKEGRLRAPVPRSGCELVVGDDVDYNAADVVKVASQHDRFVLQAS